jgi:hypothetical protein
LKGVSTARDQYRAAGAVDVRRTVVRIRLAPVRTFATRIEGKDILVMVDED